MTRHGILAGFLLLLLSLLFCPIAAATTTTDYAIIWEASLGADVTAVSSSGSGYVAAGTSAGRLIVLDASTGEEKWNVSVSSNPIRSVKWSYDGTTIAAHAADTAQAYRLASSTPIAEITGTVNASATSGDYLAVSLLNATGYGILKTEDYDTSTETTIYTMPINASIVDLEFMADGATLGAISDYDIGYQSSYPTPEPDPYSAFIFSLSGSTWSLSESRALFITDIIAGNHIYPARGRDIAIDATADTFLFYGPYLSRDPAGVTAYIDSSYLKYASGSFTNISDTGDYQKNAVAICNGAASTIVKTNSMILNFYNLNVPGTSTGTYTAGNVINSLAMSGNGLYAFAAGEDGSLYAFSKVGSSTWYLTYSSTPGAPINAIACTADGETVFVAHDGGTLQAINVAATGDGATWKTIHVFRDGRAYASAPISVWDGGETGTSYAMKMQGSTDSAGTYAAYMVPGNYYKIIVNSGEKTAIVFADSTYTDLTVSIRTGMISTSVDYEVAYQAATNTINMSYSDNEGISDSVTFQVKDTSTSTVVYSYSVSNVSSVDTSWTPTNSTVTYKVDLIVERDGTGLSNSWFIVPSGSSPLALPLDANISNAVWIGFLMLLGGVFSYKTGAKGALIVAIMAAFIRYLDWISVPWTVIAIALGFGVLAVIAEGS